MHYKNKVLHIGDVAVSELAERCSRRFYVYDAEALRHQMSKLLSAFSALPFHICYAAKANANVSLLRIIRSNGFGCDAVSPGEVFLAKHAGFSSERICFS